MQKTIDNSNRHRINFMRALKNAVACGDLTKYQANKLRNEYDE